MIGRISGLAISIVKSQAAGILAPSDYSALVTHILLPIDGEKYENVWFSVNVNACESWLHSEGDCPVFQDCAGVERKTAQLLLPDGSPLGLPQWKKKIGTKLPQYQDVVGELCLAPDGPLARSRVFVLGTDYNGLMNIKYSASLRSDSTWTMFENPFKTNWALSAAPVFPKSKPSFSQLHNFLFELRVHDHMIPEKFNKLFHGQIFKKRLYVNCLRFDTSSGKFDQFIEFRKENEKNGLKVYARKSAESLEPLCRSGRFGLGKKCYCASNIVFYSENVAGKIGSSVLYDYDVALNSDVNSIGFKRRKLDLDLVDHPPLPRLRSYRLDSESVRSDYRGISFRWIPATGPSTADDFIFLTDPLVENIREISTFLLHNSEETKGKVFPDQLWRDAIGKLEISKMEDGSISVRERRDSILFKPVVTNHSHLSMVEAPENGDLITFD